MLSLLLVPVLLGLSMLAQRPVSRWLKVSGPVWPLLPFAPQVRWTDRLAVRGAGLLFTFALVLGVLFSQARREQRLSTRVEVAEGMAAAQGGVRSGDVITAVDGVPVSDFGAVRDALLRGPSSKTLSIRRGERALELPVTLRDGLLGVKSVGEEHQTTTVEALRTALRRFVGTPLLVVPVVLSQPLLVAPDGAGVAPGSRAWLAAVTVTLTLAYWLMLLVELVALGLGAVLRPRR